MRRTLAAGMTALIVFFLLMARLRPEAVSYNAGDIADRTIRANRAATYVDKETTDSLREEAAASIPDVYTRDANADSSALQTVRDIFQAAQDVANTAGTTDPDTRLGLLRDRLDIELSPASARLLVASGPGALQRVQDSAGRLVHQIMSRQIRNNTEDLDDARQSVETLSRQTRLTPRYHRLLIEVVQDALQPNLLLDATETEAKRQAARDQVTDVRRQVQPGDIIVSVGEKVTERHLDMFTALGLIRPSVDYLQALSLLGVLVLLMAALMLFIRSFVPDVYYHGRLFLLLCLSLVGVAGLYSIFRDVTWFDILAVATASGAAIFLALTTRPLAAAATSIFLGGLASLASPGSEAHVLLAATLCALFAGQFVRPRENRSSTIARSALLTALSNAVIVLIVGHVYGFQLTGNQIGYIALGGFVSAIAAAGVTAVIERPMGLTTHLRLLELQNPNEPILKRLLTEAPGSYQSSVMVANLAEPAADAIGADPVLTRTACMYHDIGKLKRTYFFVENQFGAENPHERLSPHLSALVLMSHVKDGIEMAEEIKLPPVVASIIPQHHGTGLVSFMYQRAKAEAAEGEQVRESDFRYPGPKPQTAENAIIMLADTVEAAARALDQPTPEKIEELVNRLVEARIDDGQLDESPLTFADITIIKRSFINTLAGMFHQRLAYPTDLARSAPPPPEPSPAEATGAD
ncbi:MAG: HDIG domain-containing metalloprotein [Armatimonadia bacterium]